LVSSRCDSSNSQNLHSNKKEQYEQPVLGVNIQLARCLLRGHQCCILDFGRGQHGLEFATLSAFICLVSRLQKDIVITNFNMYHYHCFTDLGIAFLWCIQHSIPVKAAPIRNEATEMATAISAGTPTMTTCAEWRLA